MSSQKESMITGVARGYIHRYTQSSASKIRVINDQPKAVRSTGASSVPASDYTKARMGDSGVIASSVNGHNTQSSLLTKPTTRQKFEVQTPQEVNLEQNSEKVDMLASNPTDIRYAETDSTTQQQ